MSSPVFPSLDDIYCKMWEHISLQQPYETFFSSPSASVTSATRATSGGGTAHMHHHMSSANDGSIVNFADLESDDEDEHLATSSSSAATGVNSKGGIFNAADRSGVWYGRTRRMGGRDRDKKRMEEKRGGQEKEERNDKRKRKNKTSHPRIAHGQRYPMPCLKWSSSEVRSVQRLQRVEVL